MASVQFSGMTTYPAGQVLYTGPSLSSGTYYLWVNGWLKATISHTGSTLTKTVSLDSVVDGSSHEYTFKLSTDALGEDIVANSTVTKTYQLQVLNLARLGGCSSYRVQYKTPDATSSSLTTSYTVYDTYPSYHTLIVNRNYTPQVPSSYISFADGYSGVKWHYNTSSSYSYPNGTSTTFDYAIDTSYVRYCYMEPIYHTYEVTVKVGDNIASIAAGWYEKGTWKTGTIYSEATKNVDEDSQMSLTATASSGCTFDFYSTSVGGGTVTTSYNNPYYITITDETEIIAYGDNPTPTHQWYVDVYVNGGTASILHSSPDRQYTAASSSDPIPLTLLTKQNLGWSNGVRRFLGWSENSSATTATYSDGATIQLSSNKILYAVWGEETTYYTVTYNGNGGTASISTQIDPYGTRLLATATRTDYSFDGWFTAASGGTKRTTIVQTETLYAHWTEITPSTYTLTFTTNSEITGDWTEQHNAGDVITLDMSLVEKNPTTVEYHCTATFNGNGGTPTSSTLPSGYDYVTTYPISNWKDTYYNVYTSTYTMPSRNMTLKGFYTSQSSRQYINFTFPDAAKSGYRCIGWDTSSSGTTVVYNIGDVAYITSNTTYYAVWEEVYVKKAWIYYENTWKKATVWIYKQDTGWKKATPKIYSGGWK